MDKIVKQKYLKEKGLMAMLVLLSAFIPLSIDMYLPALPTMSEALHASSGLVNLTLTSFYMVFGIATLFWGPLSDKYGRKPVLLTGLGIYILGSLLCSLANNVYFLISCRVFQAVGSGAVIAVTNAIVKDSFEDKKRETMLALIQSMTMIAPIVAPLLGAFLLKYTSWKGIFLTLSLLGGLSLFLVVLYEETIENRYLGSVYGAVGRLFFVLKNRSLSTSLIIFSLMAVPLMTYVSSSAYIYVEEFGLSEQTYSFYFATNAVFSIIGPLMYLRLSKKYAYKTIVNLSLFITMASGITIYFLGTLSPIVFAVSLIPATLFGSAIRPLGVNLMFSQQNGDTGAVSSAINFSFTVFGGIGMLLTSFNMGSNIILLGGLNFLVAILNLALWSFFNNKKNILAEA